jgi:hypothetical protein
MSYRVTKTTKTSKTYTISRICLDFADPVDFFRIRKNHRTTCPLCIGNIKDQPERMSLALQEKGKNLLICRECAIKASQNGAEIVRRGTSEEEE